MVVMVMVRLMVVVVREVASERYEIPGGPGSFVLGQDAARRQEVRAGAGGKAEEERYV